ncbi:MAG: hypothetical protein WBO14_10585, partial [Gammaproteobacteria bacterium]
MYSSMKLFGGGTSGAAMIVRDLFFSVAKITREFPSLKFRDTLESSLLLKTGRPADSGHSITLPITGILKLRSAAK